MTLGAREDQIVEVRGGEVHVPFITGQGTREDDQAHDLGQGHRLGHEQHAAAGHHVPSGPGAISDRSAASVVATPG